MAQYAKYKGINVLATGDFTHPFWFDTLTKELEEVGNGLFRLKHTPGVSRGDVYFMLSCEVSSIYSQGGKNRRIHTLFMFPKLSSVEKFNSELVKRRANLRADGRPIVGISARDLAHIALNCDEKALIIPAHIWTPWYSIFGSFSGFDSVEECFGDAAEYIYGIETGLSSDPVMNWQIADLDNRAILSFSDAHSLEKMGREATVFEAEEISYDSIYSAIVGEGTARIAFTIEFYPEEGKYHFTGHRNCNFSQSPEDTAKNGDICPVCKRPLTIGVMHRVEELKSRKSAFKIENAGDLVWKKSEYGRPSYISFVPLYEIIAEALSVGVSTQKVKDMYLSLVTNVGSEFSILMKAEIAEIAKYSTVRIAEGISKVRKGDIVVEPGYDGLFGVVKIWPEAKDVSLAKEENDNIEAQLNLI